MDYTLGADEALDDDTLAALLASDDDDDDDAEGEARNPLCTHTMHRLVSPKADPRKNFVAFDTEDNSQGEVSIVNFYDGTQHWTFWKEQGDDFLDRAVRHLYEYAQGKKNLVLVAHNLEYDINNLFRWCNWSPVETMVYASRLISAKLIELKLECWDSFNLCPTSLKSMAAVLGREKGDYEEARKDLSANIGYCQSDCEILWEFMEKFQTLSLDTIGCGVRPTIGATAMRAWRKKFMRKNWEAASVPIAMDAYYGGRTEAFYIGAVGKTTIADVNSMYPDKMLREYPDCASLAPSLLRTHKFGVGKFKILVPHTLHIPPLPYRVGGRLLFPTGELEGAWTYHEVRAAVEAGCRVLHEEQGIGTNTACKPFADYVEFFYGKRLVAKKSGDEFGITYYKLLMNNLYGKTCQHLPRTIVSREEPKLRGKGGRLIPKRLLGPFGVWEEEQTEPATTTNFIWGAYVTSYARIHLNMILNAVADAGHKVLYCDTDSVMYEVKEGCAVPYKVSKEIGEMDEEHFLEGKFITAKGYWLKGIGTKGKDKGKEIIKLACKGVPKAFGLQFLMTGFAKFKRPVKMREGFVQGLVANHWRDVEKIAKTEYLKRCVLPSGQTRAWRSGELSAVLKKMAAVNRE